MNDENVFETVKCSCEMCAPSGKVALRGKRGRDSLTWLAIGCVLMIIFFALCIRSRGQSLHWNDTNNFTPWDFVTITNISGQGTNWTTNVWTIPGVTQMTYRVYFTTNVSKPLTNWGLLAIVIADRPVNLTNDLTMPLPFNNYASFFTMTATNMAGESGFSKPAFGPPLYPIQFHLENIKP